MSVSSSTTISPLLQFNKPDCFCCLALAEYRYRSTKKKAWPLYTPGTLAKMLETVTTPSELFSANVVLCKCQSLTSALTSARGPLWSGVLSSQSLCAVTAPCICDSDKFCVSGVGFFWAWPRWPEGPSHISSSDRSDVIQLHAEKLDWHFLLHSRILHAKSLSAPLWTQRMSSSALFLRRELWSMFTKLLGAQKNLRLDLRLFLSECSTF